jgi:hypothetical protein
MVSTAVAGLLVYMYSLLKSRPSECKRRKKKSEEKKGRNEAQDERGLV